MKKFIVLTALYSLPALAQSPLENIGKRAADVAKDEGSKAAKNEANKAIVSKINEKLTVEAKKNQCSFKTDSDELAPGCDAKAKKLATFLIDSKKDLTNAGFSGYKFVVSGHTDTRGDAAHNKELSEKRAKTIVKELVSKGVPESEIEAVGYGAEKPLVKPDNTPAKQAKNRRYEIQVKL